MKTYTCKFIVDFWSYETDSYTLISPTGKALKIWAHHGAMKLPVYEPEMKVFGRILDRYHEQPVEGEYHGPYWQKAKTMELTANDMIAFRTLHEAVAAWDRSVADKRVAEYNRWAKRTGFRHHQLGEYIQRRRSR